MYPQKGVNGLDVYTIHFMAHTKMRGDLMV